MLFFSKKIFDCKKLRVYIHNVFIFYPKLLCQILMERDRMEQANFLEEAMDHVLVESDVREEMVVVEKMDEMEVLDEYKDVDSDEEIVIRTCRLKSKKKFWNKS